MFNEQVKQYRSLYEITGDIKDHNTVLVGLDELKRWQHNDEVLKNWLMKACGDDEEVARDTINSQGELK